jgi:hypothetical protein
MSPGRFAVIEIKSVGGRVLYTAKDASDIRAALREAVASGADLYRADLYRANLSGANLSGADLSGANLSGANLSGANLSRADLYGANLSGADLSGANLSGANLSRANLSGANLSGANLSGADLSGADLYRANLSGANLSGADLSGANLSGADLYGAKNFNAWRTDDLRLLLHQTGKIRAYKLVDADYRSPIQSNGKLTYKIGETVEAKKCDPDENQQCGAGVNIASLPWCCRYWRTGFHILLVEFTAKDIVAVPFATDGKFRVSKVKVVKELDLIEYGLVEPPGGNSVLTEPTAKAEIPHES